MHILMIVPRYGSYGDFYQVPLGLAYVASAIESAGHSVTGLNLNHVKGDVGQLVAESVRQSDPDVIATGALSVFIDQVHEIVSTAKSVKPGIFAVLGGGVVSGEPDNVLRAINADIGVINEGEETVVEILDRLEKKLPLEDVKGVVVRTPSGRIRRNAERDQKEDLENIPWPNYKILEIEKNIANQRPLDSYFFRLAPDNNPRSLDMISSRSCPFKCTFCFHPTGKTYRERPLDDFFAELATLKEEYAINMVAIIDELFSLKRSRLLEFCRRIKPFDVKWMVQLHVNSASEETIAAMADSGCVYISYGIESMSQQILDSMMKKSKKPKVEEALALTRKYKIGIQGNLLFGDSAETLETANESMAWWARNRIYQINLTPLIVFPGSPDYNAALRDGLIRQDDRLSFIKNIPIDLNISSMNNKNMEMIRFMVYVYFESLLRLAKPISFTKSEKTDVRGDLHDYVWDCPDCNTRNSYEGVFVGNDHKNSIRMTCRGCRQRWDLPNYLYLNREKKKIPDSARSDLAAAEKLIAHQSLFPRYADAHDLVNPLLAQYPDFLEARLFMGRFYGRIGPAEHMVRSFGAAVAYDVYNPTCHCFYADALLEIRCFGGARLHYEQALALDRNSAHAKEGLARVAAAVAAGADPDVYFVSWSNAPPPQRRNRVESCQTQSSIEDELEEIGASRGGKTSKLTMLNR